MSRQVSVGTFEFTDKMRQNIKQVLDSGWISYGKFSQQFEQELAALHSCKYGILSNSGTSSLLVALETLKELHGWQDGDEVIIPALTFVATMNIVIQAKLKPILVDCEKYYYGIDCTLIDNVVTGKTRAIIPVHTFGQPCDMYYLMSIANYHDLKVIEDSCECMFVKHHGWSVGSFGDIACFSTYVAHLITTGVGGMAITNNEDYAKTMRSLVNHGLSYGDLSGSEDFNPQRIRRDFVFDRIGHSFRITELEAAIGLAQLEDWQEMIEARQRNAFELYKRLVKYWDELILPITRDNTENSHMMYPIVCKQENVRDNLTRHLEQAGISTRRMLPLTCQPVYKNLVNQDDYPVAKWINENGFYVGCHQGLSDDDLDYMAEKIGEFFESK
jgi:dTDP-4-amino-4,6-dideoxygalactose transaminase